MHEPLLRSAAERALRYLRTLPERRVSPSAEALQALTAFHHALPETGVDPAEVLRRLDEIGSPATMAMAGPRFFGFVIGGALPITVAALWLATAWDQNVGLYKVTPTASQLEQVSLRWMLDVLGLPADAAGGFVTGATVANFTALAAARHAVLARAGWDVERDGLFGAPPITVVIGAEAHVTLIKALGLLGLGRDRVIRVPVDEQGRIRADRLPKISAPAIICAQAGNVNTGAIDPLPELRAYADAHAAWLHLDGAFGLWARAVPELRARFPGLDLPDSWAVDAHKWLNVPYDSGLALVREKSALQSAMRVAAPYLTGSDERDPSDFTPELSRRARGVEIWAALLALGREGVADLIRRNCAQARQFAEKLHRDGAEILNDVVLNQVLVSFGSPENTQRVIAAVQQDGTCWVGPTVWQNKTAMRISVCNWSTTDSDVDRSVAAITRLAREHGILK